MIGSTSGQTGPRVSVATQFVLETLLQDPTREFYCREVGRMSGLGCGAVRPVLARLEAVGWVTSRWEPVGSATSDRPARRGYRLAAHGVESAKAALAAAGHALPRAGWGFPVAGES